MNTVKLSVALAVVMAILGLTSSVASGQLPLACTLPAPSSINDSMCDWAACLDTDCSPYTLKYYRSADLLTPDANITRAIIGVHGRSGNRENFDDRPYNYYELLFDAAVARALMNETLIITPYFSPAYSCQIDASDPNRCDDTLDAVYHPWCPHPDPHPNPNSHPDGRLCWSGDPDANDYPAGGNADNNDDLMTSAFGLVDDMINTLANLRTTGTLPNLNTIVVVGHSAGGQFTLRYAMAGKAQPADIAMRYVAVNSGGMTYLNSLRPTEDARDIFPNIGYKWTCEDGQTREYPAPPRETPDVDDSAILEDTNDWSTYPSSYEFPPEGYGWINEHGDPIYCVSDDSFDNWPWGLADVESANSYVSTNVASAAVARLRYLKRNVSIIAGIDDNLYVNPKDEKECGGALEGASEWNCMHALQGHARVERSALFFKYVCLGFDCANHAFETVCVDDNTDGECDFFDLCDDVDGDKICDGLGYALITLPCDDNDGNGICEKRVGHGGRIYHSDVCRRAIFDGLKPVPVETQWGKTLGGLGWERAVAVEHTPDGGYIVLGDTDSYGAGGKDLWVVRLDEEGSVLWQRTYGGAGNEAAAAMTASPHGGYLLVGNTNSFASGEGDAWIVKIDESGSVQWSGSYGDELTDSAVAVVTSGNGDYVVAGNTSERVDIYDPGNIDGWLMRLDSNGEQVWKKSYDGSSYDRFSSVQRAWDGGYILAGETQVPDRNSDFWVLKVDQNGNVQLEKVYGLNEYGSPDEWNENGESAPQVRLTQDGGYILAGTTATWFGKYMIWVLKLTDDLSIGWQRLFNAGGDCRFSSIHPTTDGGFILSGNEGSIGSRTTLDGLVMKLDSTGNQQWQHGYGVSGYDSVLAVREARDSGYIGVGVTESLSFRDQDLWVLKLGENGEIPDCSAIQPVSIVAETDPSEVPLDFSSSVRDGLPGAVIWTPTETELLHVFEGNGCTNIWDLIDLPRTGQTTRYHAGDDGHIQAGVPWPSPRFVDNGDGTVIDDLTGLIWLRDADCLGTAPWEDALDNVADFNENPESYPCASYDLENPKDDWRAPNINEMESLLNAELIDNAAWLNGQGFVDVQPGWYWSSTVFADPGLVKRWSVSLREGMMSRGYGSDSLFRIWPVRGGQRDFWDANYPANVWKTGQVDSIYAGDDGDLQFGAPWPPIRFQDNGDGTVTDNLTGLVWIQDSSCFEDTDTHVIDSWHDALDTVETFNASPEGFSCANYAASLHQEGWRVPNKKELLSLLDRSRIHPSLPEGHPFLNWDRYLVYWSSTTYHGGNIASPRAWTASPTTTGDLDAFLKDHGQPTVWPVRGGPVPEPTGGAMGLTAVIALLTLRRLRRGRHLRAGAGRRRQAGHGGEHLRSL